MCAQMGSLPRARESEPDAMRPRGLATLVVQVANKWTEFKKFVSGYSVGKKLLYTSETKSASKTVTSTVPSAGGAM